MTTERTQSATEFIPGTAPSLVASPKPHQWLAETLATHPDPAAPAVVPLGEHIAAVRIPILLAEAAAGSRDHETVAAHLAGTLDGGPVICDPARWFYALVPTGTAEGWRSGFARCLGRGAWLGVPPLDHTEHDVAVHWCVPLKEDRLCRPEDIARLLDRARQECAR